MDPVDNPYAPGAGTPPPELVGRGEIIEELTIAMKRVALGRHANSAILVGLRGVGKTVLLHELEKIAENLNFATIFIEVREPKEFPTLLAHSLRKRLYALASVSEKLAGSVRSMFRSLGSYAAGMKIELGDFNVTLPQGESGSGDLETDLPELFIAVGKAAKEADKPFLLLVDEIQYLSEVELSALILSLHAVSKYQLPILAVGAGLPSIVGLSGESKSYAERLLRFPKVDRLSDADARIAVVEPARKLKSDFNDKAVEIILAQTQGYPYFIQQWAHDCWNMSSGPIIGPNDVSEATVKVLKHLDNNFFQVRFDRCTPAEKRYLRAMAEFGNGPNRSGAIAERLGKEVKSLGPVRSSLIKKGMIFSPTYGETQFTVPLFAEYMLRVMPELPK